MAYGNHDMGVIDMLDNHDDSLIINNIVIFT